MIPYSVLFARPEDRLPEASAEAPAFFSDLNLDHVMEEAKDGSVEVQLEVFGRSRLQTVE